MSETRICWVYSLTICILTHCLITPVLSVPFPGTSQQSRLSGIPPALLKALSSTPLQSRALQAQLKQSPLSPSQFALAATRFIVMLPFLPLMMAIPGVTAVVMPLFMALQDRLTTMIPGLPNFIGNNNNNNNNNDNTNQQSNIGGFMNLISSLTGNNNNNNNNNQDQQASGSSSIVEGTNDVVPTIFRFKRSLLKLPTKALNEGFKDVFEFLHKTDDALNQLLSSQPDCRRQAVCRLHHSFHTFDSGIASFLGNLIQFLRLENRVEKLDVSATTKSILKDILKAASNGLFKKDCSAVYSRCSIAITNRRH